MKVAVWLMAYKSEATILDALDGALAQDHPCEIVVSDDASGDAAMDIVERRLEDYSGPHRVVIRRGERNLGLCAHLMALHAGSDADIVVFMAGDDISHPNRVSSLVAALEQDAQAYVIGSAYDEVNARLETMSVVVARLPEIITQETLLRRGKISSILGATMAVRREVFDSLPPLQGMVEDCKIMLRGCLLGHCRYVRDPLIRYRQHDSNLTDRYYFRRDQDPGAKRRRYLRTAELYDEIADDLERCLRAKETQLQAGNRQLGNALVEMHRIEAEGRRVMLEGPRSAWWGPIRRGLINRGSRRKAFERMLKWGLPRSWIGLGSM